MQIFICFLDYTAKTQNEWHDWLLDCGHFAWKLCPKAYQGQFQNRKSGYSSIILKTGCKYNCWSWQAAFGFPGMLNDLNVLHTSPVVDLLLDGMSAEKEVEPTCILETIGMEIFSHLYWLVHGIYSPWSCFKMPQQSQKTKACFSCTLKGSVAALRVYFHVKPSCFPLEDVKQLRKILDILC